MIPHMSDATGRTPQPADQPQDEPHPDAPDAPEGEEHHEEHHEEQGKALFRRRVAACRDAPHALERPAFLNSLRDRLALFADTAALAGLHDLDERADLYGDGVVTALEEKVAALLGKEAAAFFPTGTMAQQIALRCWAARTGNPVVALHALAHPEVHERQALSQVAGLRPVRIADGTRQPTAAQVRGFEEPFGTLMLELPLRDAGFVLPTWEELSAVVEAARERDAVVHVDGARLWETTVHFGRPLDEIADLADSVYVSFYKSLEGLGGAALAGPKSLVEEAKTWRHRYGGQVFQQFPTALSALAGLERELPRLPDYVRHARVVAAALREAFAASRVPWARVNPAEPHTQEFQLWLPHEARVAAEAAVRSAEETGWALFTGGWDDTGPGVSFTEVRVRAAGLEWTAEDVRRAVADFVTRLP